LSCVGKRVSREVDLESRMNQILGKLVEVKSIGGRVYQYLEK